MKEQMDVRWPVLTPKQLAQQEQELARQLHGQERSIEDQIQEDLNYLELDEIDVGRIDALYPQETIDYLLPFLYKRVGNIQEPLLDIREAIEDLLKLMMKANPVGFREALLRHVDLEASAFSSSRKALKLLTRLPQEARGEDLAEILEQKLGDRHNNALLEMLVADAVQDCKTGTSNTFEQGPIVQVGKGVFATLTEDGDRMYQVPDEYLSQMHRALKTNDLDALWDVRDFTLDARKEIDISFTYEKQAAGGLEEVENMLDDFMYLSSDRGQQHVEQLLGISSAKMLSLKENMQIVNHLKTTSVGEVGALRWLISSYGIDALRSFLALNEDESLGNTILEIGSKLDEDMARKLFAKYAEIVDASEDAQDYAAQALHKDASADTETYVHDISKNLRHKANDLLRDAQHALTTENIKPLLVKLDTIKAENLLWAATFREFSRAGVPIENFKDTALETATGVEVGNNPEMVEGMRALLQKNYGHYHNPAFETAVLAGLDDHIHKAETRFYLLKYKNDLAGFCRFDEIQDEQTKELKELYFGSFNVERMQFGGNGVGNAILKAAFELERERGVPIRAYCDPNAVISQKYIEWGFVAQGMEDVHGVPSFTILFDPTRNETLQSKKWTKEEITSRAVERATTENVRIQTVTQGTAPDFLLLRQGYVLSRFFSEHGTTYCVFEKV